MQELFQGPKYKIEVLEDGFVHQLTINKPMSRDQGKYVCEINGVTTAAYLDVEGELINSFTLLTKPTIVSVSAACGRNGDFSPIPTTVPTRIIA